jgi:hypothetical protein
MNALSPFVWLVLGVLAYVTLWSVVERLLFCLTHRPADPAALAAQLSAWRRAGKLTPVPEERLGWFGRACAAFGIEPAVVLDQAHAERAAARRWSTYLPMAANLAVSAGLLGSVLALNQAGRGMNVGSALGFGMHATIAGVGIGLVAGFTYMLSRGRTKLLAEQAADVAAVVEDLLARPQRRTS